MEGMILIFLAIQMIDYQVITPYNTIMNQKTLALALGGGGARGMAHIGVLKVLLRAGVQINYLAGTSFGGIIAAALACGKTIDEIEARAAKLSHMRELVKLMDPSTKNRGFFHGQKVQHYLREWLGDGITFEDLKIPIVLNAVDLATGREINFSSGPLLPALFATISVPGLFSPVEIDNHYLVDGGVLNNVPVQSARKFRPEVVIAVDVQLNPASEPKWQQNSYKPHWPVPIPDFFLDFYRAMLIMISNQTERLLREDPPDLLIKPAICSDITMFLGFPRSEEAIAAGEKTTIELLPQILELIKR